MPNVQRCYWRVCNYVIFSWSFRVFLRAINQYADMLNKKFLDQANFELQVRKETPNNVSGSSLNIGRSFCPKHILLLYVCMSPWTLEAQLRHFRLSTYSWSFCQVGLILQEYQVLLRAPQKTPFFLQEQQKKGVSFPF